ncbi:MAG: nickel-dependent lactate racemase [Thermoplasmata archaeon]|nr:MAG: nickel-dependent lactate racemase [Thermoplasmata archaeon]
MKEIDVPYGQESIKVKIPEANLGGILRVNDVTSKMSDEEALKKALDEPLNSKSFQEFISDANNALIIVNDATRPTPTARILDVVAPMLEGCEVKFIVATGIHRAPTDSEMEFIFGSHLEKYKEVIHIHDSKNDEQLTHIGTSKNGTEMYVNKLALEAQKIIIIGSVEPHYFAGYTGGRKAFLPGIAGYKTIEMNHKHALKMEAQALELDGNPVHDDMVDALGSLEGKEIFSIQVVLDRDHKIYAASAGHLIDSFIEAVKSAWDVFCVKIPEKAEIVVSVAPYPMDVDLYQSQKALDNGKLALKDKGILILVSKCRTGVGHDEFVKLMSAASSPLEALEVIKQQYKVGYHKAAKMAEIAVWAEMWGVTDLDSDILHSVFIRSVDSLQDALDEAIEIKGPEAKILFMLDGSITVPLIQQ